MNNSTMIAVVMDKSGSMASVRDATIASFNKFLSEQQELQGAGEASLTLTMFDSQPCPVWLDWPLAAVKPLTTDTYVPGGSTALLDAVGLTIDGMGSRLAGRPEAQRPNKVLVVIITDGHENASRKYGFEDVSSMIRHQETKYAWKFLYLGAGIGGVQQGLALGVAEGAVATYAAHNVSAVYQVVSNAAMRYRHSTGGTVGQSVANFNEAEVKSLIDKP